MRDGSIFGDYALLGGEEIQKEEQHFRSNYHGPQKGFDGYGKELLNKIDKTTNASILKHYFVLMQKLEATRIAKL